MTSEYEAAIQSIARKANALDEESQPTHGYAIGSTGARAAQECEALRCFLRHVREGWSVASAAAIAKSAAREIIAAHNGRRSGDVNWTVWDGAYDPAIDTAAATVRAAQAKQEAA